MIGKKPIVWSKKAENRVQPFYPVLKGEKSEE